MAYPSGAEAHGGIDYSRVKHQYDFDDYDALAFEAAGGAEVVYIVGTNAFAAGGVPPRWCRPGWPRSGRSRPAGTSRSAFAGGAPRS